MRLAERSRSPDTPRRRFRVLMSGGKGILKPAPAQRGVDQALDIGAAVMNTEIVLAPPRPRRLQIRRPGFLANGPNLILETTCRRGLRLQAQRLIPYAWCQGTQEPENAPARENAG